MGTRSIVAKPVGDGWFGRYCHWDGYPEGVGLALLDGYEWLGYDALVKKLIDDEQVGWSSLAGTDLTLEPTWYEMGKSGPNPTSYTARGETDELHFTESSEDYSGAEWLYIMAPAGIFVAAGNFGMFGMGGGNFRDLRLVPWGDAAAMKACDSANSSA